MLKNNFLRAIIMALMLIVVIFVGSCKKESSNANTIDNELLNEIRELPTLSARRIAFSTLAPPEKLALLHLQFDYIMENIPLNDQQHAQIEKLKLNLTSEMYSTNSKERADYIKKTVNKYREENLNLFGREFIGKYFATIINPRVEEMQTLNPPATCPCNWEADWCPSDKKCQHDESGACTHTTNGGCGDLWIFDCNGTCINEA